jgi:hypothetical protein
LTLLAERKMFSWKEHTLKGGRPLWSELKIFCLILKRWSMKQTKMILMDNSELLEPFQLVNFQLMNSEIKLLPTARVF